MAALDCFIVRLLRADASGNTIPIFSCIMKWVEIMSHNDKDVPQSHSFEFNPDANHSTQSITMAKLVPPIHATK